MILLALKLFFFLVFATLGTSVIIQLIGLLLPKKVHVVTTRSLFHNSDALSHILKDTPTYPSWKPDVSRSEPDTIGWKEHLGSNNPIQYEHISSSTEPDHIMIRTVGDHMPFQLERTYKIWRQDHMTFLQVEDMLHINKPYLRTLGALIYNHKTFAKKEVSALEHYLDREYGTQF